jgi:PAS domain S-box-containing protein
LAPEDDRGQARNAPRESEELYRLLAENSTEVISRHTPEGVYTYVSPACRSLLGYEPEELVGRSVHKLVYPEDLEQLRDTHLVTISKLS